MHRSKKQATIISWTGKVLCKFAYIAFPFASLPVKWFTMGAVLKYMDCRFAKVCVWSNPGYVQPCCYRELSCELQSLSEQASWLCGSKLIPFQYYFECCNLILIWDCLSLEESNLAYFIKEVIVKDQLHSDGRYESWCKSFQVRKYSFHSRGKILGRAVNVLTF